MNTIHQEIATAVATAVEKSSLNAQVAAQVQNDVTTAVLSALAGRVVPSEALNGLIKGWDIRTAIIDRDAEYSAFDADRPSDATFAVLGCRDELERVVRRCSL